MSMSANLRQYLERAGVKYELVPHPYASTSLRSAESAHVPGRQMAKSVIFEDDGGYLMAVVPATHRVDAEQLSYWLQRPLVKAEEGELNSLFRDCARGAVPPLGQAYGLEVVWDDSLAACQDVYFEAGDHTELVHMSGRDFCTLMAHAQHGKIGVMH